MVQLLPSFVMPQQPARFQVAKQPFTARLFAPRRVGLWLTAVG